VEAGFAGAIKRAPTDENEGGTQAKREMGAFPLDSLGDEEGPVPYRSSVKPNFGRAGRGQRPKQLHATGRLVLEAARGRSKDRLSQPACGGRDTASGL